MTIKIQLVFELRACNLAPSALRTSFHIPKVSRTAPIMNEIRIIFDRLTDPSPSYPLIAPCILIRVSYHSVSTRSQHQKWATSTRPERCHVARWTPQLPHLWLTSLVELMKYGIQQHRVNIQRPQAHAFVVLPLLKSQLVNPRLLQAGQSTGTGLSWTAVRGTACAKPPCWVAGWMTCGCIDCGWEFCIVSIGMWCGYAGGPRWPASSAVPWLIFWSILSWWTCCWVMRLEVEKKWDDGGGKI